MPGCTDANFPFKEAKRRYNFYEKGRGLSLQTSALFLYALLAENAQKALHLFPSREHAGADSHRSLVQRVQFFVCQRRTMNSSAQANPAIAHAGYNLRGGAPFSIE